MRQDEDIRPGLVILGASEFRSDRFHSNPSFLRSKEAFKGAVIASGIPSDRVLDLFNTKVLAGPLADRIDAFMRLHQPITDVIIYYCGHGDFTDGNDFYLALAETRKGREATEGLNLRHLRTDLGKWLTPRRVYLVLDCCHAAAALTQNQWMSGPLTDAIAEQIFESFPKNGTALLAAAPASAPAKAFSDEELTVFTGALVRVLRDGIDDGEPRLGFRRIFEKAEKIIKDERAGTAPLPELYPRTPDHADITETPIFLNSARRKRNADASSVEPDHEKFMAQDSQLRYLVVGAEAGSSSDGLHRALRLARDVYWKEIEAAADELRRKRRAAQEGVDKSGEALQSSLSLAQAFSSTAELKKAVEKLCRADVAVFDITELQSGVMCLLGIRSVVRRGVTVCSSSDASVKDIGEDLPFHLQGLNVSSHSAMQKSPKAQDLLGLKIIRGLRELASLPEYLDLPAYDAVRALGPTPASFKSIPRKSKVLVLCPYSPQYESLNWEGVVADELYAKLRLVRDDDKPDAADVFADTHGALLVRLCDIETPRLVLQTFYDFVRRVEMCVVDWTKCRPNVMFELGVRMAANRLGAVHIIDTATPVEQERSAPHVRKLMERFNVLEYSSKNPDANSFRRMVEWFDQGVRQRNDPANRESYRATREIDYLVYDTVADFFAKQGHVESGSVVANLVEQANLISNAELESTGTAAALYHDVSAALRERAQADAAERRIAAWLYMDDRHSDADFAANPHSLLEFRKLAAQVRLWLNKQRDDDGNLTERDDRLLSRIRKRIAGLAELLPEG
jgi:hypothetical protein